MSTSRSHRVFGPLLDATLALAFLVLLGLGVWTLGPSWHGSWKLRSLAQGLRSPDPLVSYRAAEGLSKGGPDAVPYLVEAAKDQDSGVRLLAVSALGRVIPEPTSAIPTLADALRDPDTRVRLKAADALAQCGPEAAEAGDGLIAAFADPNEYPDVRFRAARAYWRLKGQACEPLVRALLDLVASPVYALPDRKDVVDVIHQTGGEPEAKAILALARLTTADDFRVRREVVECLGRFGTRAHPALQALENAQCDDDRIVRCLAALSLSEIEGWETGRARSMLEGLVDDPELPEPMRKPTRWTLEADLVGGSQNSHPVHRLREVLEAFRQAEARANRAEPPTNPSTAQRDETEPVEP
jgi:hypothetical protein